MRGIFLSQYSEAFDGEVREADARYFAERTSCSFRVRMGECSFVA